VEQASEPLQQESDGEEQRQKEQSLSDAKDVSIKENDHSNDIASPKKHPKKHSTKKRK
jgi:hypothetical protein